MYDYEKNYIEVMDGTGRKVFKFQLRENCVIVDGLSGTGKTLFVNTIRKALANNINLPDDKRIKNVLIIDEKNKSELGHLKMKHGIVIIDRADFLFDTNIADYITMDFDNQYLVFSRTGLAIPVSPNYYAEIKHRTKDKGKEFYLEYAFSEEGWY